MHSLTGKKKSRILIVDDNPAIHDDFRKIFAADSSSSSLDLAESVLFGSTPELNQAPTFELISASQGDEALELVRQSVGADNPFAMAFMDVRMPPGLDGIETTARIWEIDPEIQIVLCTAYSDYPWQKIVELLGRSDRLLILKKPFDIIEVVQLGCALTEKWRLLQEAKTRTGDLERRVSERTSDLREMNERLVTEMLHRTQAEEGLRQAQKMEAIGQLAGGIAHDFNNLLTIIRGYTCCLLDDEDLDPKAQESLQQVDGAAQRAANLTRQLLAFSRKQITQLESVDLNDVIAQIAKMLDRVLGDDIAIEIITAKELRNVYADRAMIEQVILNLAVNARDAMPKGGRLLVRTWGVELKDEDARGDANARAGKFACFSVTDSGSGIAAETMPHLFEPFFTTKEVGKGTGLGLATVYGILKQHQGWINVESVPGHGATFKIFLPVETAPAKAPARLVVAPKVLGGNETILLVEDEPILRALMRTVLQHYGYRVYSAGSGLEALKVWAEHKFQIDLLLTDMVMPDGLTGRDVARKLQADDPDLKVIYSSGYSLELLSTDSALKEQFNFLPKPYTPDKLAKVVRDCLEQESSPRLCVKP